MKKLLLVFLFSPFLFASVTQATPLKVPDELCINSTNFSSPNFKFLTSYERNKSEVVPDPDGCFSLEERFKRPHQLYYKGEASRIKILLNNDELVNAELAPLKTTTYLTNGNEIKSTVVYECIWYEGQAVQEANACPLLFDFYKYSKDLKIYDGKSFKIFMDNNLVRDYKMSFRKGNTNSPHKQTLGDQIFKYITYLFAKLNLKF